MLSDSDIKIAGDKPSRDIVQNKRREEEALQPHSKEQLAAARRWGKAVAKAFKQGVVSVEPGVEHSNLEMLTQRRILLSFAASVGFEKQGGDDFLGGLAQKAFLDTLQSCKEEQFVPTDDTGAFSFYYLALRKGFDVERRIGQTFAMLCSHDGDPIYQELGEALYCWFLSVVKSCAKEAGILD